MRCGKARSPRVLLVLFLIAALLAAPHGAAWAVSPWTCQQENGSFNLWPSFSGTVATGDSVTAVYAAVYDSGGTTILSSWAQAQLTVQGSVYNWTVDAGSGLPDGPYLLKTLAYNNLGQPYPDSGSFGFEYDATAPSVSIQSVNPGTPAAGQPFTVSAAVYDNLNNGFSSGIMNDSVLFQVYSGQQPVAQVQATENQGAFTGSLTVPSPGQYTLKASARDLAGNTASDQREVTVSAQNQSISFSYTDADADHAYFDGNNFGVTVSGLNIPDGNVRVAVGVTNGLQFDTSMPVLSGMTSAGSYYFIPATASNGTISINGTISNPNNSTLPTGVIGIRVYTSPDGGNTWQPAGEAMPVDPAGEKNTAIIGVMIPEGNITASPALSIINNLYNTETAVRFTRYDSSQGQPVEFGSIEFSPGLDIISKSAELAQLQNFITLMGAINLDTGEVTYTVGVDTASLTFLAGIGATIRLANLPEGFTNIQVVNQEDLTAVVSGISVTGNTLTFNVNHFSNYKVDGAVPPAWPGGSTLTASNVGQTGLTLTWTAATDNVAVTQYKIYKNGTPLTTVGNVLTASITGLTPGTQHNFKVEAGDAANSWSTTGPGVTVTTQPAQGEAPALVSAATNTAGTKVVLAFSKAMASPAGKHGEFAVTVNGTGNTVTAAALNRDPARIDLTLTNPVSSGDVITVGYTKGTVLSAAGGALESFTGQAVTNNGPVKITNPSVSVDENSKNLAVTDTTPAATVTVPGSVTDATLIVATLLNAPSGETVETDPLPALTIEATTAISASVPVKVEIPAGTKIKAAAADNWDGTINVPAVKPSNSVTVTPDPGKNATVSTVIEVGFGDVPLTFDKAVRILIPGQAGKDAGYYRGSTFTKITNVISSDSQAVADSQLPEGGDGKIDAGSDLVIWTRHFTRFIAYTQTASSGGGGGGPAPGEGKTITASGGTITDSGATIIFPANAVTSEIKVKVEKVTNTSGLPLAANSKLVSDVLEITRDKPGNFEKPVTVTLAFDKSKADAGKYNVSIFWFDEGAGKWVELKNVKLDPAAGKVSGDVDHFTKFAVIATEKEAAPAVNLKDIAGHWAQNNIKQLVVSGAISGYPDGTFKPDSSITRAEFASVLVKAFKLAPQNGKVFADTAGHWARNAISTAASYGIVNGYNAGTFGPDDLITREQMAAMIVKAAKLSTDQEGSRFKDSTDISAWARSAVNTSIARGIMKGYPDNTFKPQGNATRAEAVTVVVNAIK